MGHGSAEYMMIVGVECSVVRRCRYPVNQQLMNGSIGREQEIESMEREFGGKTPHNASLSDP